MRKIYSKEQVGIKVYQFDYQGNLLAEFNSKKDALKYLKDKHHDTFDRILLEKREYKGYYWATSNSIDISQFKYPYKYKVIYGDNTEEFKEQKELAEYIGRSKSFVCNKLKQNPNGFSDNEYIIEVLN